MQLFRLGSHEWIQLDDRTPLGCGGEGRVFAVAGIDSLAAKVYDVPEKAGRAEKLHSMLRNPPLHPMAGRHVPIAWPLDLLAASPDSPVVGYLMPRIRNGRVIDDYYNPPTRLEECPLFHYEYLLCAARNLAAAVHSVHKRGYVLGDVKQSNILVTPSALVSLVDTDSFQVVDAESGHVYRCPVGTPEYTPPELQGETVPGVLGPEHDLFGLAVLIFQLLMEGSHPFAGVYRGDEDPPPLGERIRLNHFPYLTREPGTTVADADNIRHGYDLSAAQPPLFSPGRKSVPFHVLAPEVRALFLRCFSEGYLTPCERPTAQVWLDALDKARASLLTCGANTQHRYGDHLDACPWCARMATQLRGSDPFPSIQAVKSAAVTQPPRTYLQPGISVPPPAYLPEPMPTGPPDNRATFGITSAIWATGVTVLMLLGGAFAMLSSTPMSDDYVARQRYDDYTHVFYYGPKIVRTGLPFPASGSAQPTRYPPVLSTPPVQGPVSGGLLSPDGRRLVLISNRVTVEDTLTGNNEHYLGSSYLPDTNDSQFAFSRDGSRIAVCERTGNISLWNDRANWLMFKKSLHSRTHAIALAPDGRTIAVGQDNNGFVEILSTDTGILKTSYKTANGETPYLLRFTPDGKHLLIVTSGSAYVANQTANVKMYCMDVGTRKPAWLRNDLPYTTSVEVSPNSRTIAIGGVQFELLSAATGVTVHEMDDSLDIYEFSPDGRYLAAKGSSGVRFFEAPRWADVTDRFQQPEIGAPLSCAFDLDGKTVVSIAMPQRIVYRWNFRTGAIVNSREF